ncbi:MFS transporter [Kineosporia sp. NBRC 101731]|uniref:MFS transporter n=1 Tax=Kineosporia sp. NBRC 101731 TaxID=3032199 RepID=UPI0024A3ADAF|nr:MFS transporter [Kineosporia sp. NBRC 101731]GLY31864.1 MFS transporter [Kineosporia sp. NBRC 101731]
MTTDPGVSNADESRRQQRAWYVYDWANSAFLTTTLTVLLGPYLTVLAKRDACPGQDTDLACDTSLHVLGVPVSPGSLSLYTVTFATLFSALLLPLVGALADRSGRKRSMLAYFAWTGSAAGAAMVFLSGDNWQLGVALQLIATLAYACSIVVYDSLLIDVAGPDERDRVSSRGWAIGYVGGTLLLVVNLVLVTAHDAVGLSTEGAVRLNLLLAGLWWGLFTIVPYRRLRDRPPVDPVDPVSAGAASGARAAFRQLGDTLRHLRGYPQTMAFLIAYLVFNDGIQTIIYASGIYAQEQLGLSSDQLILAILIVQFVAVIGALSFGRIAARTGAYATVRASLVVWCGVIGIGYFLPHGQFLPFAFLAALIGLTLGGTQALSRSLYSHLIPRGREAEYFSLYAACERGTSWLGTLAFGLTFQLTHSYRYAIIVLIAFFVVGGLLLNRVNVGKGITQAGNPVPAVI